MYRSQWQAPLKILLALLTVLLLVPKAAFSAAGIDQPLLFEQGTAFLNARAYHLALDRFLLADEEAETSAERAEALRGAGEAYLRDKDFSSANHDFFAAVQIDPLSLNASDVQLKSAIALVFAKNYTSALDSLKNVEKNVTDIVPLSDIYFWEGECYYQTGEYKKALKLYETILRQNLKYPHAQLVNYLVDWCLFQEKDFSDAYDGFDNLSRKARDPNLAKLSAFQAAECQFWLGNYSDAEAAYIRFTKAYSDDPMVVPAYYGWGWSLAEQDKHLEAAKIFHKITTEFPDHPLAPWAALREGTENYAQNDNEAAQKSYEKGLTLAHGKTPADFLEYGLGWMDYSALNFEDALDHFQKVEKFSPQSPLYWDALYLRAGCLYLEGKYDLAKKVYDEIADPAPQELTQAATYWSGWCDYASEHYDEALKRFLFVAQNGQTETRTRGYWGAAESCYQLNQYANSVTYYQDALQNNPGDELAADCYSGLGWAQFQQENYSDAITAFQKVIEKAPESPLEAEAYLRIGDSYYNLHDYKNAAENYQKALAKNTGTPAIDSQEQLGWCEYRQEHFSRAVSIWTDLSNNKDAADRKSRLLYWTAWAYFRNKDFKHAQKFFQQVETDYPDDALAAEAHLRSADCFFNLQRFKDAKAAYQSFIDKYPRNSLLPDALYGLQWSTDKLGLKDESSQVAVSFLEKFPDSAFAPSVQYRLADTFFQNKRYKDAIDAYRLLLQKYPESSEAPKALFWMATALSKDKRNSEAIDCYIQLIKKYPDDPLALEGQFNLGSLYYDAGDFKDALGNYTHIFKSDPKHHLATHAIFNSAVCEKEAGEPEKALDYFEKLVNDYGSDPLAPEASLQSGILLEKLDRPKDALKAYEFTIKSKNEDLSAEAAFYHADLHKTMKEYPAAIDEFNALIQNYPDQDQWVVTAYAKVAECYEAQKKYQQASDTYHRILKYTKIPAYRQATMKRLKALQPFLHPHKKKTKPRDPVPAAPEVSQ